MMTVETGDPLLRRKIVPRAAKPGAGDGAAELSGPSGLLVRSFARSVSRAAPLVAEQGAVTVTKVSLAELLDQIDQDAFVSLLAADDHAPGLALLSQIGFMSIIEAMTIGRFAAHTPGARRPTGTDANLLADILDATLAHLGTVPDSPDTASRYRFSRAVPDHRLLPVLLDDTEFEILRLSCVLIAGEQERDLELWLCLPDPGRNQTAQNTSQDPCAETDPWGHALENAVLQAPVKMRAELGRVTMNVAEVMDLTAGAMISLPLSNLEDVRLVALDGEEHAVGRLGQTRGMRAMRIISTHGTPEVATVMTPAIPTGAPITQNSDAPEKTQAETGGGKMQIPGAAILTATAAKTPADAEA